ncbi:Uncharacterized protein Fot_03571 [Forsythia ovata]|uniref:Uncharacterized protein n=1 Tax=Forsythia ovata TaxID=205694 RepID=A0ABD1XA60_9LAMI
MRNMFSSSSILLEFSNLGIVSLHLGKVGGSHHTNNPLPPTSCTYGKTKSTISKDRESFKIILYHKQISNNSSPVFAGKQENVYQGSDLSMKSSAPKRIAGLGIGAGGLEMGLMGNGPKLDLIVA